MLFQTGGKYPPTDDLERLARYEVGQKFYQGKGSDIYERAVKLLRDTPHYKRIKHLNVAVNLVEILVKKPADMLIQDPPTFESGKSDDSPEQIRINRYVEENDLVQMIYEMTISNGYLGDQFIKSYYSYREDFTELVALGGSIPPEITREIILEPVNPRYVFVELKEGTVKTPKAVNIAFVEWVERADGTEIPFLSVERHIAGAIQYKRFELHSSNVEVVKGIPLSTYTIGDEVSTGKENDVVLTGVPHILVQHIPYKTNSDSYYGESFVTRVQDDILAIEDILAQISYILTKHTDPIIVTPPISGQSQGVKMTGGVLEVGKEDPTPFYMTWDGKLTDSFALLEFLVNKVFQQAETPQFLFGNVIGNGNQAGGTSHTTSEGIKSRYLPILSKVRGIRSSVDKATRTILYYSMVLENKAAASRTGYERVEPIYPLITWKDGIPRNLKEEAETAAILTGNEPILDRLSAIKSYYGYDDETAREILDRLDKDAARNGLSGLDTFNQGENELDE